MSSNFESKTRAKREFSLTGTTRSKSNRKEDEEQKKLDDAFKGLLDDMKPFVLSLSKKNGKLKSLLVVLACINQLDRSSNIRIIEGS